MQIQNRDASHEEHTSKYRCCRPDQTRTLEEPTCKCEIGELAEEHTI